MTSTNDARLASARGLLRDAIAVIEEASEPRHDVIAPRVDGSWSVIDHHERDGLQYLVVVGGLHPPGLRVLAPRELQVLAAAACGQTTKVIAFELGMSDSTVRVLLARAAKKLGVRTRAELVALYLRVARRPSAQR